MDAAETFELTVQRRAAGGVEGWPVVAEYAAAGGGLPARAEGTLRLDPVALLPLSLDASGYGEALGRALFAESVRDAFRTALDGAAPRPLRVLLCTEAEELRPLRWERLCAPLGGPGGGWSFLGLDQRAPLSQYLPSLTDRRFPPVGRRDLRALVLVASPGGLDAYRLQPFDAAAAAGAVRAALAAGDIPCDVLGPAGIEGWTGPPMLDALCERLTAAPAGPYTLLHVVCHGRYVAPAVPGGAAGPAPAAGETVLYLEDAAGGAKPVAGTELLRRLAGLGGRNGLPRLVFLAACDSASPEAEGPSGLGGLAQRLVRELGTPATVAMTEPVPLDLVQALAATFYRRLRAHGEPDLALAEARAGLAGRADVTVPAVFSRLGGRSLFSDTPDRPLTPAEVTDGLERLEAHLPDRAPVLLKGLLAPQGPAAVLRGTSRADPQALSAAAQEARVEALRAVDVISAEALDLSFAGLALGQDPPPYDARCPFRGLESFRPEDRAFFFGREALVQTLRQRLTEHPFLAVLGPSGSGKSSVVLAGLVPALQREEPGLQLVTVRPGTAPPAALAAALATAQVPPAGGVEPGQVAGGGPGLVVVDQFEELFTLCRDEAQRRTFLERLLALLPAQRVVLTMRADFWGECALYPALREAMEAHQSLLAPMNAAELRRAMELQAGAVGPPGGLRFEADVGATIVDDVQGEPGAMPLLQHALLELWNRRHGRWLRAAEYRAVGGVRGAIARTADAVYERSPPGDRERLRDAFLRLTRPDDSPPGAGPGAPAAPGVRRDAPRRVALAELVPAGQPAQETEALVQRLAGAHLVVTDYNAITGQREVEVAHEALIRHWPRLRAWLGEEGTTLALREGVRQAAQDWRPSVGPAGGLGDPGLLVHRAGRLQQLDELLRAGQLSLNAQEAAYVEACVALREQERAREARATRRLRIGAGVLAVLAALVVGAGLYAGGQRRLAEAGEARGLVSRALAQLPLDPEESVRLAREAYLRAPAGALRTEIAVSPLRYALSASHVRATLGGHTGPVEAVAFSPDGRLLATASDDGTARLWEGSTWRSLATLPGHPGGVTVVAFSPQGDLVLTAGQDGAARTWRVPTGEPVATLTTAAGTGRVAAAFSPDGRRVVTGDRGGAVQVWEAAGGLPVPGLHGHSASVASVEFSPDGRLVVSASADRSGRVWDTASGAVVPLEGHQEPLLDAAFSPDGRRVVTASQDGTARVWDAATGAPLSELSGHTLWVTSAAFSPDGRRVVTASGDTTARVWDAATGRSVVELRGHGAWVGAAAFSPDGSLVVTAGQDGTARVWDPGTGEAVAVLRGHTQFVANVAFSPGGAVVATAGRDGTARVWDAATGRSVVELRGHGAWVAGAAFSPDGRRVVTAAQDGTARVWDAATGAPLSELRGHGGWVTKAAFSPDGRRVVTASQDGTARVWDAATGAAGATLSGHGDQVEAVAFSPDGRRVVTGGWDGRAWVWDAASGRPVAELRGHTDRLYSAAFSPDGRRVVTAGRDATVRLWDPGTGAALATLSGHSDLVNTAAFSPDGRRVVTASHDRTARVWDATTGAAVATLSGHAQLLNGAAFSPDGRRVVTASQDGTARVWDAATGALLAPLSGHASPLSSAAFSPDGSLVVTAAQDATARVWDAATGQRLVDLRGHTLWVTGAAFSPDGRRIVTASGDQTARVFACDICVPEAELAPLARTRITR